MKKLWNMYRRIIALMPGLFLIFISVPCSDWRAVSAAGKDDLCSDEENVTICSDVTPPEICDIIVEPKVYSYAHGNYSKETVKVEIIAKDVDDGVAVSGIQKLRLFFGDAEEAFKEIPVKEDVPAITGETAYRFNLELTPELTELEGLREIQISAVDNKGNESSRYIMFNGENGFQNNLFMIDQYAPSIIRESMSSCVKTDEKGKILSEWYKEIPEKMVFVLSDKKDAHIDGSGLLSASVVLDDMELPDHTIDNKNEETAQQEMKIEILQQDMEILSNGEHRFVIITEDFAENTTTEEFVIGIDDGAPLVTETRFEEADVVRGSLGFGGFGNYHNKSVKIILTIADTAEKGSDDTAKACVGAKEVELYLNGILYGTEQVDAEHHVVFTIPENLLEDQFFEYTEISVITRDFLDNQSEYILIKETQDGSLVIETQKPVIMDVAIKTPGDNALRAEKTESSAVFYCKSDENGKPDIDFIVKAGDKDNNSGLEKIKVVFNDRIVFEENYVENLQLFAALTEGEKTFNLKETSLPEADVYYGEITVTDKAGNEAVFIVTVYADNDGPEVWLSNITEPVTKVNQTFYYNSGNVMVEMKATDKEHGVGVRAIEWGVLGESEKERMLDTLFTDEKGTASFVIMMPEDTVYEECIYMKAIDRLDNAGQMVKAGKVVIENQEMHDKQNEKHVWIEEITKTSHKDENGNLLYTGKEYHTVQLGVFAADSSNGISSIEWTVKSEAGTYADLEGCAVVDSEKLTVTGSSGTWNIDEGTDFAKKVSGTITLETAEIEADNITVHVTMTDLSGNTSTESIVFSVDNTAPVITIEFDDVTPDSEFTNVYKEARTATIKVVDRNFGVEQLVLDIINTDGSVPQISDWMTTVNAEEPNATTSVATLVFAEDGDYSISACGKDLAGLQAETVIVEEFTIDTIDPVMKVTYTNDNVINRDYYAEPQTAVITIEEHNFVEERIEIAGTAMIGGTDAVFPQLGVWSSVGDTHTAVITFETDGLYQFRVDYRDKAGREAEKFTGEEFYVDMTAPVIEISGVEDLSANNGEVAPIISVTDFNYNMEGITIDLYGANGGKCKLDGTYSSQTDGQIFTFANFTEEQSNDDIYTVTVTASDMAGNESADEITFSVNRFGSVYVFDDSLKEIAGMYVQDEIDVRLTEVNADSLEHDTIRVVVNANGLITDLREGTDYTVSESGGNGEWYRYDYVIDKSLFAGDGRYIVALYSEDAAGNINENLDESKKAEIRFGIDKTPPVVIPIDIAGEAQYAEEVKTATVAVNDNLVLKDVQIFAGENQIEYMTEGENYVFSVPGSGERQDITIAAVDAAGNRTNYVINGVLITTNAFIRWYNNTPLFVGSIAGTAVLSGAGAGFIGLHRRRRAVFKKKE